VARWAEATTAGNLAGELEALALCEDLLERCSEISVPVLLRVGSEDVATPATQSEELARVMPRATLEIVPGVGHALLLEDWAGTRTAVQRFL
jgi:pimeloyl-ACP methyl ester carboxylesterase